MKQAQEIISYRTRGLGHHDITPEVRSWVERQKIATGLLTVLIQHVLAALSLRQNADRDDLQTFFRQLENRGADPVPPAASLYASQLSIPVRQGGLALGARQGVFLLEQRETANTRQLVLHLIGE